MAIAVAVTTMKAAQVTGIGAGLEIVEREIPQPGPGEVRIKVQACGVCHSDAFVVEGSWPGIPYPRVPGHEVVGVVDALGDGVTEWRKGQRVVSVGTVATTASAVSAGGATFETAAISRSPASATTAATTSTCRLPLKRWCRYPIP